MTAFHSLQKTIIILNLWKDGPCKAFKSIWGGVYPTNNLRIPYMFSVALISILYGEEDVVYFKEPWILLLYKVTKPEQSSTSPQFCLQI